VTRDTSDERKRWRKSVATALGPAREAAARRKLCLTAGLVRLPTNVVLVGETPDPAPAPRLGLDCPLVSYRWTTVHKGTLAREPWCEPWVRQYWQYLFHEVRLSHADAFGELSHLAAEPDELQRVRAWLALRGE
jgi:hypothetical protein